MVEWSLDVLREVCDRVVVAVPADRAEPPDFVAGGATRSESVRNALDAAPEASVVVVHDAARPLVTVELVRRCIDALEGYDGVIAAMPVTDTVKEVEDGEVIRTPDRGRLWAAQTPQVFRADALRQGRGRGDGRRLARRGDGRPRSRCRGAAGEPEGHDPARCPRGGDAPC